MEVFAHMTDASSIMHVTNVSKLCVSKWVNTLHAILEILGNPVNPDETFCLGRSLVSFKNLKIFKILSTSNL